MLNEKNLPKYFWADAVSTTCYVSNHALIGPILKKNPYELYKGKKKPNIAHLYILRSKCFVLNNGKDNLENFDAKSVEGIFLGYQLTIKAYRTFSEITLTVNEYVQVSFDETNPYMEEKVVNLDEDGVDHSP